MVANLNMYLFFFFFFWLAPFLLLLSMYLKLRDHRIRIRGITLRNLSITQISYTRISTATIFTCCTIQFLPHFPRPSAPYWATFIAYDIEYKDNDCHVSLAKLEAKLWFFPHLFRFTAGPWVSTVLDDFRVRIFSSAHTPYLIKQMRENLVDAVLKGEVLRLDEFHTELKLGGLSKVLLRDDIDHASKSAGSDDDEVSVTATVDQYHVVIRERRYYSFGQVVAQLRRNWALGQGSFTMIAQDSRWTRVPLFHDRPPFFSQMLLSMIEFPFDLFTLYDRPMALIDLHVTRTDVTFDEFRIRDAELIMQGLQMLEQTLKMHGLGTVSAWGHVLMDMVLNESR